MQSLLSHACGVNVDSLFVDLAIYMKCSRSGNLFEQNKLFLLTCMYADRAVIRRPVLIYTVLFFRVQSGPR
jgi:ABC-type tungstate transport system substrate-binding protein